MTDLERLVQLFRDDGHGDITPEQAQEIAVGVSGSVAEYLEQFGSLEPVTVGPNAKPDPKYSQPVAMQVL